MAIYTLRRFSAQEEVEQGDQPQVSSKELQIENMKLQREIMRNQRHAQKLQEEERKRKLQEQLLLQRVEAKKNQEDDKNQLRLKESQNTKEGNKPSTGVYKRSTTPVKPISMK